MATQTTTITPEYEVDFDDPRFAKIDIDTELAVKESDKMYDERLEKGNALIQSQINASKQWADSQSKLQQEQTDFAIEQIEQQKKESEQGYLKEQSAAFTDYKKETNDYSVGAEQMAAAGLKGSGYSETVKGGMYNAYQNRIAVARAALDKAIQNFDNAITQAKLQNSAAKAEIAYNALQEQISLALAGFEFENAILDAKASAKAELYQKKEASYQDVYEQIMREKELEALYGTLDLSALKEQEQLEIDGARDIVTVPVVDPPVQPLEADISDTSDVSSFTRLASYGSRSYDAYASIRQGNVPMNADGLKGTRYENVTATQMADAIKSGDVSMELKNGELVLGANDPTSRARGAGAAPNKSNQKTVMLR